MTPPRGSRGFRALGSHPGVHVTQRVLLAVVGGYLLTEAVVSLLAAMLAAVGMVRSEAVVLSMMLGFVIYLLLLLWAFAERRLLRLWIVFGGATALAMGAVRLVQAALSAGG
ncbi:MAG: iron uptake protein [Bacteroidota bacterium]